ncbi:hypothetical protein TUM4438_21230 [Shewanella sairae]|uniref:HNH nuclease domain-containing protein n=1 Tax=Shewanella sairae TaxID=190310 RepID=A0ABQ4PF48_9GAMM|nr:HNH endonuclease domain-containing protein [Shewanella sairae]MCL1131139.1 hypothetical protein [Shewanella sairae]GIU46144.1 hypothetical protein TUM4438_21230 [Shewanella sairae]
MLPLPSSNKLDIPALSRIFDNTTNSYKLLFFRALLSLIQDGKTPDGKIDSTELAHYLLAHAWVPSVYFKLNLGTQDQIVQHLYDLNLVAVDLSQHKGKPFTLLLEKLAKTNNSKINKQVLKYVPYRLLQPFFSAELQGKKDAEKNNLTYELSQSQFDIVKPIYKISFIEECNLPQITLHPDWYEYLCNNIILVQGWAELNWTRYLQRKNPNTPSISNKLTLNTKRESLVKQRKFWDEFISQHQPKCIFTGEQLSTANYELDHFVPWSYVAHNQFWNLLPILNSCNSSKSNKLPDKCFLQDFAKLHFEAVTMAIKHRRIDIIDDYITILQCPKSELTDKLKFTAKLSHVLQTVLDSAGLQGFEPNWKWTKSESKQLCIPNQL